MNIGRAAEASGVAPKTIRYYESIGLIQPAERRTNNYRDYSTTDVETLRFVQRGRGLGFSMKEIADLLALWRDKGRASHKVKIVAERHISDIDRRMAELAAMRRTLSHLMRLCHGDARPECPILDDLAGKTIAIPKRRPRTKKSAA
jgi:MerR family transcriptional regulator, copper efflux regulator